MLYGDGEKHRRDLAYSEAMRELAERYPDDLEARSFWALSILGTAEFPPTRCEDFATRMDLLEGEAAALRRDLERALERPIPRR